MIVSFPTQRNHPENVRTQYTPLRKAEHPTKVVMGLYSFDVMASSASDAPNDP